MTSPTAKKRAPSTLMAPSKVAQTPEGALAGHEETQRRLRGPALDSERRQ
jgi:hypothetical protein